jgi:hypothetical protein
MDLILREGRIFFRGEKKENPDQHKGRYDKPECAFHGPILS